MNMTTTKESIVKQLEELAAEYQGRYDEEIKKSSALTDKMLASKDNDQFRDLMQELRDCNTMKSYVMGKIHAIIEALDIIKIG